MMHHHVAPATVRRLLRSRAEVALLDVRPEAVFAHGHPLFAANLPLGRIEVEALDRLPRSATPVVVYGRGLDDASRAVATLTALGYTDVSLLDGGLAAWESSGGELFVDVNAPSKAFGELVESVQHTPKIAPEDLAKLLAAGEAPVIVDARRYDEYHTMNIPTSTSVPGAELVLRVGSLAPDPSTLIVVNCAGRTRSIIGTQSLLNAGVANRVLALRNGTIGWTLAGLELDHGQDRRHPDVGVDEVKRAAEAAGDVARRAGLRRLRLDEVAGLAGSPRTGEDGGPESRVGPPAAGGARTVYRFDVRTPEEFAAGHLPCFRSAPGGQLVQETDHFAPVRGATVVLFSGDGVRAEMTGSWLAQMGWDTVVVDPVADTALEERGVWQPTLPSLPDVSWVTPDELAELLVGGQARVVDVNRSPHYRAGHLPDSLWAAPGEPIGPIPGDGTIVVSSSDGALAAFATAYVAAAAPGRPVVVLAGGTEAWSASGRLLEVGAGTAISPIEDVYRRPYEGTDADPGAMQAYLEWEYGLVAQLERDGTHNFTVLV
jgi:rhodanese-related sulfurtransferase